MPLLTEKQQSDLNHAILEYLHAHHFEDTADYFKNEAKLVEREKSPDEEPSAFTELEQRWSNTVRLQLRITELEERVKRLQLQVRLGGGVIAEGSSSSASSTSGKTDRDSKAAGAGDGDGLLQSSAYLRFPRAPEKATLKGHRSAVTSLAFHPAYTVLVSGSEDGTLRIWDCERGSYDSSLRGHTNTVTSVDFAPPAGGISLLASGSSDTSVKIWQPTFTASSSDDEIKSSSVTAAISTGEDTAKTANVESACKRTLMGHDHTVSCVRFASPTTLVSASRDGTAKLWDTETGFCLRTLHGHDGWVRGVAVGTTTERQLIATCGQDKTVRLWELDGSATAPVAVLSGHENVVETVCFAQMDGKPVVVSGSRDKTLRVWDLRTMNCEAVLDAHENWVRSLATIPGSPNLLCSTGNDKSVLCWDLDERRCIRTLKNTHKQFVVALAICPTHGHLATGSDDSTVKIWDASSF